MGLFKSYESSGAGIPKYTPKKKGLALFFDLFFRKIWKITGLNLLFSIFLLPIVAMLPVIAFVKDYTVMLVLLLLLFILFAVNIGPAIAGMTKVMRAFIIEKHTFVVRDFFKGFRDNFKKASIIGVLDIVIAMSAFAGYNLYPDWAEHYNNKFFYVPLVISLSVALIAFIMNYYIFLMLTATDLSMKNLFKNSFALAFVSLKQNFLTTFIIIVFAVFVFLLFLYIPVFLMLIIPFFPAALVWFIVCFDSYPVIQKYVINPYYDSIGEVNPELSDGTDEIEEEAVFEDMGGKEKPVEKRKKSKGKRIS